MERRGTVESGRQASGDRSLWIFVALALVLAAAWYYQDIARFAQRIVDAIPIPQAASVTETPTPTRPRTVKPPVLMQKAPSLSVETISSEALPPLPRLYPVPQAAPPPPAGRAGLVVLLRDGELRLANNSDIARWKLRYAETHGRQPPREFYERWSMIPTYVIVGDVTFPSSLYGADSVIFLLERGVPYPAGDPGHSPILDMASGNCIGATCRMMLD
ncbi:MAG: hypothetical protein QM761_01920 [Pseudoxanthomonas sp.]